MILRPDSDREEVIAAYQGVRKQTEDLCAPLQTEDYVIQAMDDVSPPKWHISHVTWFFETFLLSKYSPNYKVFHPDYGFLFNSYYETIGDRWARPRRGLLSRPTVKDVYAFRAAIDGRMRELIASVPEKDWNYFRFLVDLGLNHEQQHQELLLTDIKNILGINPLHPVYRERSSEMASGVLPPARFVEFDEGIAEIGFDGTQFSFDNERPKHRELLQAYKLQNRLVTNREYLEFIHAGGYGDFRHWLSEGWAMVQAQNWKGPLYWEERDGVWMIMTLAGLRKIDPEEPVCHVSYFEADAYARWRGKRLPTEGEWENAAVKTGIPMQGNFMDSARFHPAPATGDTPLLQMYGDVWEWTSSAYLAYPGFQPEPGAVGEYNGKFMSNQMVLRGGSCATPANHIRTTYRNFFQCDKRWQFTGIRLGE